MIESVVSGAIGAALRFVPEIFKLVTAKRDQAHELEMTKLQLEIDKARATQQIDLVHAQAGAAESAGQMTAFVEAIKTQGQPTGIAWVDALNASVRPLLTYWWMTLFTVFKVCSLSVAWQARSSLADFTAHLWTADDLGVLSMILGFWFVDRAIRKDSGR